VKKIFTDIAVVSVTHDGLVLDEVVEGWTAEAVQACTEPPLHIVSDLRTITAASLIPV
jgi:3-oxoacid CoA-transferase subunit B